MLRDLPFDRDGSHVAHAATAQVVPLLARGLNVHLLVAGKPPAASRVGTVAESLAALASGEDDEFREVGDPGANELVWEEILTGPDVDGGPVGFRYLSLRDTDVGRRQAGVISAVSALAAAIRGGDHDSVAVLAERYEAVVATCRRALPRSAIWASSEARATVATCCALVNARRHDEAFATSSAVLATVARARVEVPEALSPLLFAPDAANGLAKVLVATRTTAWGRDAGRRRQIAELLTTCVHHVESVVDELGPESASVLVLARLAASRHALYRDALFKRPDAQLRRAVLLYERLIAVDPANGIARRELNGLAQDQGAPTASQAARKEGAFARELATWTWEPLWVD